MFNNPTRFSLTGAAAALLCAIALSPAHADLMITNVTIIDPVDGATPDQDVLIGNDTIAAIGDTGSIATFAPVDTLDGTGKFLIPALWDAHVHVTFNPDIGDASLPLFVANGVTRVRDTGGKLDKMLAVNERALAAGPRAPMIYFAGPLVDGEPRVYDGTPSNYQDISIGVTTPDDATREVARLADAGVSLIKTYEMLNPETFQALVAAARSRGLPVTSHVPLSMDVTSVAAAGVNGMEHMRNIGLSCSSQSEELLAERHTMLSEGTDEEGSALRAHIHATQRPVAFTSQDDARCASVIQALADNRVFQTPTLALNTRGALRPFLNDRWDAGASTLPWRVYAHWKFLTIMSRFAGVEEAHQAFADWSLGMTRQLHLAGVPLMAGTDTPIGLLTPGFSLHQELETLVLAGLTPQEALHAATVRPAEFFGLEAEMGRLAPGMSAELVLLTSNPLEDITNTRTIDTVITRDTVLDRAALDHMLNTAADLQ